MSASTSTLIGLGELVHSRRSVYIAFIVPPHVDKHPVYQIQTIGTGLILLASTVTFIELKVKIPRTFNLKA